MTPSLEATLRRLPLAKLQAYRNIRYQRGNEVVLHRWHFAKAAVAAHPDWPCAVVEWEAAESARQQWEAGLAELDALIAERTSTQYRLWEEAA